MGSVPIDRSTTWPYEDGEPGPFTYARYSNPTMDELIMEQAVAYDREARVDVLHRIAELTHEDPAAIFLWSSPNLYAVAAGVTGFQPHYLGYVPVVNVGVPSVGTQPSTPGPSTHGKIRP